MKYTKEEVVELVCEAIHRTHKEFRTQVISVDDIQKDFLREKGFIEEELIVGQWYKLEGNKLLINYGDRYGFDKGGKWCGALGSASENQYIKATDSEVSTALIAEWEKENMKFNTYRFINGLLQGSQNVIQPRSALTDWKTLFNNGVWAEKIEEEKEFLIQVQKGIIIIEGKEYTAEEIINKFNK